MLETMSQTGIVRRDGQVVQVPAGWKTRMVDFGDGEPAHSMTVPWGDVVTAYKSTGIPNIMVYIAMPAGATRVLRLIRPLLPLLATRPVQNLIKKRIDAAPAGPDDQARAAAYLDFWGEARAADGQTAVSRVRTPDGYTLTARMSLNIAKKICSGQHAPGFQTPSTAYGKDLILEMPGTERIDE
jgi:short subunit dehydrogenase-like uncharacterized protein